MTMKSKVRILSLGMAFTFATAPVWAQDAKEEETSGSVTVGAQGGSGIDESSKLQQYETVPVGVILPEITFSWKNSKDLFLDVKGTKLGLDDQFASLDFGKKGGAKLNLVWDQNPNWMSNTARTPYTRTDVGNTSYFHVPDGMRQSLQNVYLPWVTPTATNPVGIGTAPANPTVPNFFAVDPWVSNSQPIDVRYVRKTGKGGLDIPVGKSLNLNVTYSQELRDGNKATTFYGGPSYEVATPIKYKTDNFRVSGDFAQGRFFANAALNFNKFTNDLLYAEIDNPERLEMANPTNGRDVINDAASFRLWLPPDNSAFNFDVTGGVTMPKRHKLTASLSKGNMKMDQGLLPISTNPKLQTNAATPNPLYSVTPPYGAVDIEYKTLMGAVKFTGDPHSKFGYSLTFRKYELKDENEEYTFNSTARGDVQASYNAAGFIRESSGFATQSLRGEVHALPVRGLRLGLSYGQDKREYDMREYADVTDDVFIASVDYNYDKLSFHGTFQNLSRKPGDLNTHAIQPTWQGATQTDITERDRKMFTGLLTYMPTQKLAISLSAADSSNEFAESVTGLLDQSGSNFGIDVTVAPTARLSAWAGYMYETYNFLMAAAYFPRGVTVPPNFDPKNDPNYWENDTEDKVDTYRIGLQWEMVPEKLDLNASLDYTKPRSASDYTFIPGGTGEANGAWPATPVVGFPVAGSTVPTSFTRFPVVSKNFTIAKISLDYTFAKNLTASVLYWKQKFDNVDWQYNQLPGGQLQPYMGQIDPGSSRWFFMGAGMPSYNADIFRASLTYRF